MILCHRCLLSSWLHTRFYIPLSLGFRGEDSMNHKCSFTTAFSLWEFRLFHCFLDYFQALICGKNVTCSHICFLVGIQFFPAVWSIRTKRDLPTFHSSLPGKGSSSSSYRIFRKPLLSWSCYPATVRKGWNSHMLVEGLERKVRSLTAQEWDDLGQIFHFLLMKGIRQCGSGKKKLGKKKSEITDDYQILFKTHWKSNT